MVDNPVEVSHEDYQRFTNRSKRLFRFRQFLSGKMKHSNTSVINEDNIGSSSVASAVTNGTGVSNATIKTSNRTNRMKDTILLPQHKIDRTALPRRTISDVSEKSKKSGWEKLMMRFHNAKKQNSYDGNLLGNNAQALGRVGSEKPNLIQKKGKLILRRSRSNDSALEDMIMMQDHAIRGRLDGIDILPLGPARLPLDYHKIPSNDADILVESMNPDFTPSTMILDMMKLSAGREAPEIIFEGFYPGDEGRWVVRIDPSQKIERESNPQFDFGLDNPVPVLCPMDSYEVISSNKGENTSLAYLMESMWGEDNIPPTHQNTQKSSSSEVEENILQLASECNVPIDIDEDTFIVETAEHLQNIHDIAAIPLQRGDFHHALKVFNKILAGLKLRHGGKPHFLIGTTLHNIGIIQMWQGNFKEARRTFEKATTVRKLSLNHQHEDIGVSLVRHGLVCLAIGETNHAINSFQKALSSFVTCNASRAKILNNLGVAQLLNKDSMSAMENLKAALEMQKKMLSGKIRRDSIIFDAAITLSNLGKIHFENHDFEEAVFVYEESLLLQTSIFRRDSFLVLLGLGNIAFASVKSGNLTKASSIYTGLMRSFESLYGKNSCQYNEILGLLGHILIQEGKYKEACQYLSSVLLWQEQNLIKESPYIKYTKEWILSAQSNAEPEPGSLCGYISS